MALITGISWLLLLHQLDFPVGKFHRYIPAMRKRNSFVNKKARSLQLTAATQDTNGQHSMHMKEFN